MLGGLVAEMVLVCLFRSEHPTPSSLQLPQDLLGFHGNSWRLPVVKKKKKKKNTSGGTAWETIFLLIRFSFTRLVFFS